jgi:hypothetical protein
MAFQYADVPRHAAVKRTPAARSTSNCINSALT